FKLLEEKYNSLNAISPFQPGLETNGQTGFSTMKQEISEAISNNENVRNPKRSFYQYLNDWTDSNAPGGVDAAVSDAAQRSYDAAISGTVGEGKEAPIGTTDILT